MLEYIKIYKNFYKSSEVSQLVNDCDISMYTLKNFDSCYNCIDKLNNLITNCKDNNIYTSNDYAKIIHNQIRINQNVFNSTKLNSINIDNVIIPQPQFIKLDTGKKYLSIDIRHAFSQFVDSLHIFNDKFDDIIFKDLPEFIKESKKARIFMYYQIPNHFEIKHGAYTLFSKVFDSDHPLIHLLNSNSLTPISYNLDELVYDITSIPNLFDDFIGDCSINNIDLHINTFEQHYITYINPDTNVENTIPIREYYTHTNYITHTCKYMNQIYKAYNDLSLVENDLYVSNKLNWNNIDKLKEPIKITNII